MDHKSAISRLIRPVIDSDHIQGKASALVTLVEYGDYQCRDTRAAHPVVKRIQRLSGDWLRFVFRNFPDVPKHDYSEIAAEAAEAAGAQDMFWQMHDYLLQRNELDEGSLMDYAEEIGLDLDRFEIDLQNHVYKARVQDDIAGGMASGVNKTPTFFMNGIKYQGRLNEDKILQAIEDAAEVVEDEQ